jgi:hypothetical protein
MRKGMPRYGKEFGSAFYGNSTWASVWSPHFQADKRARKRRQTKPDDHIRLDIYNRTAK